MDILCIIQMQISKRLNVAKVIFLFKIVIPKKHIYFDFNL